MNAYQLSQYTSLSFHGNFLRAIQTLFFLLTCCFICACTTTSRTPTEPTYDDKSILSTPSLSKTSLIKKQNAPSQLSSWEISGAMAARNKQKGWNASLNWVQRGINQYKLRLFGPLGGGTVIIEKKGGTITYIDGSKAISSHNADELLLKQTGIQLPVHNLYYWVRGLPAPGAIQSEKYDDYHHLVLLSQSGYSITYANYTSVGGLDLPGKIQLQGHSVVIKFVIKHWAI